MTMMIKLLVILIAALARIIVRRIAEWVINSASDEPEVILFLATRTALAAATFDQHTTLIRPKN